MHVSRRVDYGVRALAYLAADPPSQVGIHIIVQAMAVPQPFMSKVMRDLVQAGLVQSQVGPGGGYRLSRDPSEISFRHIVEAIDGPVGVVPCQTTSNEDCILIDHCSQVPVWDQIRLQLLGVLDAGLTVLLAR